MTHPSLLLPRPAPGGSAEPPDRPRGRGRRLAAALVATGLFLSSASPAASQESVEEAREDLLRVEEERLRVKSQVDLLAAEDIEVLEALNAAKELVDRQEARVAAVRQDLRVNIAQMRQKEIAQDYAALDIRTIRQEAVDLAVEAYLRSESEAFEALLGTEDITSGLRKLALLDVVRSSTTDLVDRVRLLEDEHAEAAAELAAVVAGVEALEAQLQEELVALEDQRLEQVLIKKELDIRRQQLQVEYNNWDQEAKSLEAFIQLKIYQEELRRQQEEMRRRARELGVLSTEENAALGFLWPTAGYVGSGYGYRIHPILGGTRFHAGIDMGSVSGQEVYASKSGVVIRSDWAGGYGNVVIVEHGGGFSSLYAHLLSRSVSTGDFVQAGQVVGLLGSTGLSTGPHLHFEIRVNGAAENPLKYLPG